MGKEMLSTYLLDLENERKQFYNKTDFFLLHNKFIS